ncbi:MAG: penicillin acylase family protein [Nocardioidaceae bacterium]|nr:penicillin acylase family protein [Nocardioidaceae bacterium]NUS52085.1 penicillin acylase family protein [Nocardioidaceae bacterium]
MAAVSTTTTPSPHTGPEVDPNGGGTGFRSGFFGWPRWARWTAYVAVAVVLALVAGLVAGVLMVRHSFPQTDGRLDLPGLDGNVQVQRDAHGIPQVYAGTSHDLFYAQGFVQAQDRFFEMDVRRHATAGRLSELFGDATLDSDKMVRTMGWRRVAEQELSRLSPQTQAYLQAYSDGVNAYIHTHTPEEMSLEYSVLNLTGLDYKVEDWTPADSVSWLKAMAWDLRGNMEDEVTRAIMSARRTPAQIAELYPPYPYARHRPIVDQGAVVDKVFEQNATGGGTRKPSRPPLGPEALRALRDTEQAVKGVPPLVGHGDGLGSNAWAVDGDHSTTGKPILANDPHLGVSLPGVWYQMGLHCTTVDSGCPFDVSGFTFAGMPGVVIGHNQQVAWGFTNLGPDVTDLYLEKVTGKTYLYAGKQRGLRMRDEQIQVRGRTKPFRFTVRSTRHGPLLSDVSAQLSTVGANAPAGTGAPDRGNGYAVALQWTALTPGTAMDAVFELDRARDWQEFREGAADFDVPAQNMVYADTAGNIGYQAPGRIPIRKSGNTGDYPSLGWLKADDWTGSYVPFSALPNVLNPSDGFVATANQAVTGRRYPYYLGDSWAYGYRSQRIVDLLQRKPKLSVADMSRIQLDTRNGFAPTLVPYLLRTFMPSDYLAGGQRLLQGWSYHETPGSAAAAYYNAVWKNLLAMTFHDELGQTVWPDGDGRWFEVMRRLLAQPDNPWWDDVNTDGVIEHRDDILAEAMAAARDELVRRQARRAVDWTWGHQHQMELRNPALGQATNPLVRWLFNRGGYELGGGSEIVNATGWDASTDSYDVTYAPSMRMVVSLADLDASRWVNLTGASGHAFNSHYVDQTDLWADGRSLAWPFTRRDVKAATEDTLTLRPEKG